MNAITPRDLFDGRLLVARGAGRFHLIAGLFFNDRDYECCDGLDLMCMCLGQ